MNIEEKRFVQHPMYPTLMVDKRTTQEVERSRDLTNRKPRSLSKSAKRIGGQKLRDALAKITRDLDGAYRLQNRLDGKR